METEPVTPPEEMPSERRPSTALKFGVLIILILLLVVGILLPIKLVPNAVSTLSTTISSWFSRSKNTVLSIDKNPVPAGDEFVLSWNDSVRQDGTYVLKYACVDNVHFETSISEPSENIPCTENYYFTPSTNEITLKAVAPQNHSATVPIMLGFLAKNSSEIETVASTTLALNSAATGPALATNEQPQNPAPIVTKPVTPPMTVPTVPVTKPVPTPTPTKPESKPEPAPAPKPTAPTGSDLVVRIVATGMLDTNGNFIQTPSIPAGSRAAVKFTVVNRGDTRSQSWAFTSTLPSSVRPTYSASNLGTIAPGGGVMYVLGFDGYNPNSSNRVTITITGDTIKTGNTASIAI